MKIINLTQESKFDLSAETIELVETLAKGERSSVDWFDLACFIGLDDKNNFIYDMLQKTPIFIIKEDMKGRIVTSDGYEIDLPSSKVYTEVPCTSIIDHKYIEIWGKTSDDTTASHDRSNRKREGVEIIDPLGCYSAQIIHSHYTPMIFIWEDRIQRAAEKSPDPRALMWLNAKVIIHELAHRLMDVNAYEYFEPKVSSTNPSLSDWREESLANAFTLTLIEAYGDMRFLFYAENFMSQQYDKYKLGIDYFCYAKKYNSICYCICNWMLNKQFLPADEIIEDWLKYVCNNIAKTDDEKLNEYESFWYQQCYRYHDKIFTSENLVFQVVNDFLANNPSANYVNLQKAFPDSLNSNFNVFDRWPSSTDYQDELDMFKKRQTSHLKGEPHTCPSMRFFTGKSEILQLADCKVVLSDYWHPDDMSEFIQCARKLGLGNISTLSRSQC